MDEDLKKRILEVGELIKQLPEKVQERAFELLLSNELRGQQRENQKPTSPDEKPDSSAEAAKGGAEAAVQSRGGEDLALGDLHLKAKKFLDKEGATLSDLNGLFYKEGGDIKPLFEDLKTTKASESQIRLGLLAALRNAIEKGEFEVDGEDLRRQCQLRKTYDGANFNANFKNNRRLFEKFETYDKATPIIRLSQEGRTELEKLIKELQ